MVAGVIDHRDQVILALRAAAVVSPTSYSWFGRRSRPLPAALRSALDSAGARMYLIEQLEDVLYRLFYTQGSPVPGTPWGLPQPAADPGFVDVLSRSNTGRGGWSAGWRIERVDSSTITVERDGLHVRARDADCRWRRGEPAAAMPVSVRRPNEHRSATPGFYTALGDAPAPADPDGIETRVYFHLTPAGGAPFVAESTSALNHAGLPFTLKVVDRPGGYMRCDAGVIYLHHDDFGAAREPLRRVIAACALHLRPSVPAFAKPLVDGVAVGEHRASLGGSFGSSRCRVLAEAIVSANQERLTRLDARLEAVHRRFADSGLDLAKPYLTSASVDRYVL